MVARRLLVRTVLVPVVVFVLALLAIAATTRLQSQARKADAAEKRLAKTETALNALATAPFRASKTTGGSASLARTLIDSDKAQIDTAIARLLRDSPPAALSHVSAPLLENYVTFERIFQIGVAGEYGREADGLAATAAQRTQRIIDLMNDAERTYAHRSATAGSRARIGSALMILLLVAAFAFLYRRATRARSTAERLVVENARLLAGSRIEALTDSLTGLPNRRSLVRDLETAAGVAAAGTDHVLALFDLDGFKQY
ncbi:MAG: hypothetical protein QOI80_1971, partial [Solirubrobacteraceae bacterium]|nr:hypothetical protein [Solirubrobacteraceae bacterium]